ncbi:MAG: hypothetical protein JWM11_7831 [Planctomycetaceae bacterium]|nr:hypothetical protein [Planctomycetaceae bacterium]
MSSPDILQQSVRAGVFTDMGSAERAVVKLLANGFEKEQVMVVCSGEAREHHFRQFDSQNHTGISLHGEVATGAALGATVGGLAAIAFGLASGAIPLVIAGAAGIAGGSTMGGFMGAMMSRGVEDEFSKFYHEQMAAGHLVVVVEDHGPECETRLALASEIFTEAGCLTKYDA